MFEKILVPLDGSEYSWRALEKAVQVSRRFGGKITLIHVYPDSIFFEEMRKSGEDILAVGEKRAKTEGVEVESLLLAGHPVEEILRTSREGYFDLIILGSRGVSRIKELLIGSVTSGVTKHAPCSVLVAK